MLESAERHLRDALALDPGLLEARLRLGRVLDLQDRAAAGDEWRKVLAARPGATLTCLARALLGSRALRRGAFQDAAAHHREAVAACPQAQSVHLGLSLALRQLGDGEGAGRELEAALATDPVAVDPWLRYATEPQRGLAELLEELRR
jgi:Flp pilus assembly protein TadD